MAADRFGNALAASHAGRDELVGIGPVHLGTRRAAGGSAGAARLQQQPIRLPGRVVHGLCFPGLGVDVVDAADQPDRSLAVAGGPDLTSPLCVAVRAPAASGQLSQEAVAEGEIVRLLGGACGLF
jgi:hypothetical protein